MKTESRFIPLEIELRADGEGESVTLVSHAPPWESLSKPIHGEGRPFREVFKRGAFTNLSDDIIAGFNHEKNAILGRTSAGTLRLSEDDTGLRYEVDLSTETTAGRDVAAHVKRGDVKGSSFEFVIEPGGQELRMAENGDIVRTVTKAKLFQVGPVTRPIYDTEVAFRSMDEWLAEETASDTSAKLSAARRRLRLAEAE